MTARALIIAPLTAVAVPMRLTDHAARINAGYQQVQDALSGAVQYAMDTGDAGIAAKAAVKAELGHGAWGPWLEKNCPKAATTMTGYMRLARNRQRVAEFGKVSLREALRLLARSHTTEVMGSSDEQSWFTPKEIIWRAKEILQPIHLDPAWHPDCLIRAERTFTVEQNGLDQVWEGNTWLNPPHDQADPFIAKLVRSHESGAVPEALALLPARVGAEWFSRLDPYPRCFIRGRLTFANSKTTAPFPSAVVYLGKSPQKFKKIFESLGPIFARVK